MALLLYGSQHLFEFQISEVACFNHAGYFVLILFQSENVHKVISETSQSLRELGVINAVYVIHGQSSTNVQLVSYDWARKEHINLSAKQAVDNLFARKYGIFREYRYRVLLKILVPYFYVEYDQLKGFDVQLLDTISQAHLATAEYTDRRDGEENITLAFGDSDRRATFDLSLFRSRHNKSSNLDWTYLPEWDELCISVPKRHHRLGLLQLTKPFNFELWIVVVALMVLKFLFNGVKLRLIILAFVILEFNLTEGYLAKVIQFLSDLKYYEDPKTIEQLIERNEVFAVFSQERVVLEEFEGIVMHTIENKKETLIGEYATIHYCKTAEVFERSEYNFNPRTNDKLVIILEKRLRSYASCYGFAKNHPIRTLFEHYMRLVFESGIWRKIYGHYTTMGGHFSTLLRPNDYPIGFEDLVSLWILLGLGLGSGFVCFLAEICRT